MLVGIAPAQHFREFVESPIQLVESIVEYLELLSWPVHLGRLRVVAGRGAEDLLRLVGFPPQSLRHIRHAGRFQILGRRTQMLHPPFQLFPLLRGRAGSLPVTFGSTFVRVLMIGVVPFLLLLMLEFLLLLTLSLPHFRDMAVQFLGSMLGLLSLLFGTLDLLLLQFAIALHPSLVHFCQLLTQLLGTLLGLLQFFFCLADLLLLSFSIALHLLLTQFTDASIQLFTPLPGLVQFPLGLLKLTLLHLLLTLVLQVTHLLSGLFRLLVLASLVQFGSLAI